MGDRKKNKRSDERKKERKENKEWFQQNSINHTYSFLCRGVIQIWKRKKFVGSKHVSLIT